MKCPLPLLLLTFPAAVRYVDHLFARTSAPIAGALTTTFDWHGGVCYCIISRRPRVDAAFCDELLRHRTLAV